jgi:enamine deaminase RidA (YjgF/YER057c/UK114 family)
MTLVTTNTSLEAFEATLPTPPKPVANYIPAVITGNLLYTSGCLPMKNGQLLAQGSLGSPEGPSLEAGQACAEQALINALSIVKTELGSLSRVKKIVKLNGFVQCTADFKQQPIIMNAASDKLVALFGADVGSHARTAVGTNALPLDAPVELELIVEFH